MENTILIFKQTFNIGKKEITGILRGDGNDYFLILYQNNKEIKNKIYNDSLDNLAILTEMEKMIEEL